MARPDSLRASATQPRKHFDEASLLELADSIAQEGVFNPILCRRVGKPPGELEIVAGERRWRAAKMVAAGYHSVNRGQDVPAQPGLEVPVIVRSMGDKQVLLMQMVENIQRCDMTPMEEARGFARLYEEFGVSLRDLERDTGVARAKLHRRLALVRLPVSWQERIDCGEVPLYVADLALRIPESAVSVSSTPGQSALEHGLEVARASRSRADAERALERLYTRPIREEAAWSSEAMEEQRLEVFEEFCLRELDGVPEDGFETLSYAQSRRLFPFDATDLLPMNNGEGFAFAEAEPDPIHDGLAPGRVANGCWGDLAMRYGARLYVAIDGAMDIRVLVRRPLVREAAILAASGPEDCLFAMADGSGGRRQKDDLKQRNELEAREAQARADRAQAMLRALDTAIRARTGPPTQSFYEAVMFLLRAGAYGMDGRDFPGMGLMACFGMNPQVGEDDLFSEWPGLLAEPGIIEDDLQPAVESFAVCSWVLYQLNMLAAEELADSGIWQDVCEEYGVEFGGEGNE